MAMFETMRRSGFRASAATLFFSLAVLVAGSPATAKIYAYTDNQGRIRIQDLPDREGTELALPRIGVPTSGGATSAVTPRRAATVSRSASRSARFDPETFRASVKEAAATHKLSESLIFAVMRAESNFNPYAVSSAGAQGLMQLIPSTARLVGVVNSFDPHQNIHGGAKYLRMMLDRFGRVDLALAAYNAGPQAVERYGGIPPFAETLGYVPRVMRYYQQFGGTGELVLTAARALTPTSRARSASTTRTARAARSGTPTVAHPRTPPLWYYRGPDGQIYISNIKN